jgi:hypothetical protein
MTFSSCPNSCSIFLQSSPPHTFLAEDVPLHLDKHSLKLPQYFQIAYYKKARRQGLWFEGGKASRLCQSAVQCGVRTEMNRMIYRILKLRLESLCSDLTHYQLCRIGSHFCLKVRHLELVRMARRDCGELSASNSLHRRHPNRRAHFFLQDPEMKAHQAVFWGFAACELAQHWLLEQ